MADSVHLSRLRSALQADAWFRDCAPELQDVLLALGRERRLLAGEHLFAQGDSSGGLHCVVSGALTVQSDDVDGQMPVLVLLSPFHWFGELSFTDGLPRSHDAVADLPSVVWCVPRAPMLAWLDTHPVYWRDIARLAVGKLRVVYQVFDEEMRRPMSERVARRLWLAVQGWGWRRDNPLRDVHWSQEQLARMLGSGRPTVNQALRTLEAAGAIRLHYGRIEVLDPERLRRACDGPAPVAPTRA